MAPVPRPKHDRAPHYIRQWRNFRGLNQGEVADAIGVDQSTISNTENGKVPYNQDTLEKLAILFECDVVDLISLDPKHPDPPRVVFSRLRQAPKQLQDQALAVVEALLKAG